METMKKSVFTVKGMSCLNCVKHVQESISKIGKYNNVTVTLHPPVLKLESNEAVQIADLNASLTGTKYSVANYSQMYEYLKTVKKFLPLIIITALVILFALAHQFVYGFHGHIFMQYFMAGYFLLFGGLKIANWKKFVPSYRAYDDVAKRSLAYTYAYPAIEFAVGIAYYVGFALLYVNIFVVILMLQKAWSVYKKLRSGDQVQCACLGGFFNIPVTKVTLAEDLLMAGMALWMLL